MSRELKFRAWDKEDKKYLLPENQEFVILPTKPSFGVTIPFQSESYPNENLDIDCVDWADADLLMGRYELEQYTRLKDKNGKEIYEGDIVKTNSPDRANFNAGAIVMQQQMYLIINTPTYGDARLSHSEPLGYYCDMECEIIGNIHENSELLGSEE